MRLLHSYFHWKENITLLNCIAWWPSTRFAKSNCTVVLGVCSSYDLNEAADGRWCGVVVNTQTNCLLLLLLVRPLKTTTSNPLFFSSAGVNHDSRPVRPKTAERATRCGPPQRARTPKSQHNRRQIGIAWTFAERSPRRRTRPWDTWIWGECIFEGRWFSGASISNWVGNAFGCDPKQLLSLSRLLEWRLCWCMCRSWRYRLNKVAVMLSE